MSHPVLFIVDTAPALLPTRASALTLCYVGARARCNLQNDEYRCIDTEYDLEMCGNSSTQFAPSVNTPQDCRGLMLVSLS